MGAEIYLSVLKTLNGFFIAFFGNFMQSFGGFAKAFFIIYIVLMGFAYFKASFGEHTKEVGWSILLMMILYPFVFETSTYHDWIVRPILGMVDSLAAYCVSLGSDSTIIEVFTRLDTVFALMVETVDKLSPGGSWNPIKNIYHAIEAVLVLGFMILCFGMAYIAFLLLLVMGFFGLYAMFLVGGICLFFAAFKSTRFITWAWCRSLANYGLQIVFAALVMGICLFGLEGALKILHETADPSQGFYTKEVAYVICWSLLTFGMLLKSPDWAAALSGGMAGSTTLIAGGLSVAGGTMLAGAQTITHSGAYRGLGKTAAANLRAGAGAVGTKAYSAMKGIYR